MRIHAYVCTLAVLVLAVGVAKADIAWPNAPYGSIVAVAKLTPVDKGLVVRGSVAMVWPRPGQGTANVTLNMTGALSQMTMAHIHLNTTGRPIRLDLLPLLNGTRPMQLNPPLSFRGIVSFTVPFTTERVAAWDPDNNHMNFIEALQQGLLYVNVHSAAFPAGALQGKLVCKSPCMFSIGGSVVRPGGH